MKPTNGFTLIEMIVVVAILAIISTMLLRGFIDYARYQTYQGTVSSIKLSLAQSQAEAKIALQDANHGFYIESDQITFYTGDAYNALDTTNKVVVFGEVTITPTLTNGVSDVRLNKVTGLPSATGTITILGTRYPATTVVTITDAGVLYYE